MLKGATARRYAEAVFEIAKETGTVDRWLDDVRVIAEYFGNHSLAFVLREPKIPFARKELIVNDLLASRVQHESLNLAKLLVERELVEIAPPLRDQFERLYNEYRGQAYAQVTTAIPLDDDLRASVTRELQEITGKRIILREQVDPSILGGAIARVGDTLIDGSLRRRFALLRRQIVEGGSFGGHDDGTDSALADLFGPDGGSGGAGGFVIAPIPEASAQSGNGVHGDGADSGKNGNSASSNDVAPRSTEAPHLAPRPGAPGGPERRNSGKNGNPGNSGNGRGGSNKRRKR